MGKTGLGLLKGKIGSNLEIDEFTDFHYDNKLLGYKVDKSKFTPTTIDIETMYGNLGHIYAFGPENYIIFKNVLNFDIL